MRFSRWDSWYPPCFVYSLFMPSFPYFPHFVSLSSDKESLEATGAETEWGRTGRGDSPSIQISFFSGDCPGLSTRTLTVCGLTYLVFGEKLTLNCSTSRISHRESIGELLGKKNMRATYCWWIMKVDIIVLRLSAWWVIIRQRRRNQLRINCHIKWRFVLRRMNSKGDIMWQYQDV